MTRSEWGGNQKLSAEGYGYDSRAPPSVVLGGLVAGLDALPAWQATAVVLALSLGGALLLELVGVRLARRLTRRTETSLDDIVFEELRIPLVVTVALAGVYVLTRVESVATATLVDARTLSLFSAAPR
jgi:hypothetical protein